LSPRKPPTADLAHIAPPLRPFAVELSKLTEDPANARKHSARNLESIRQSLQRFGQQTPIVVRAGVIIKGNATARVARELGWTSIAAIPTGLSDAELIAYGIADNRTGELAEWDDQVLERLLTAMPEDLRASAGWQDDELSEIRARLIPEKVVEDEPPAPDPAAVSRPGDLWVLGEHRLLCGDSTKAADVDRVLDGRRADLVATDPPYVVNYTGVRPAHEGRQSGKDWSKVYREIDITDATGFFRDLFTQVIRVMADGASLYCWHAETRSHEIRLVWDELKILHHQNIIWVKPVPTLSRTFWLYRHEPCMMGWRKGSKPQHDGDHAASTVWEVAGDELSVWYLSWEGKRRVTGNEHPTQKPVEIFARPMRKHTMPGATCFEPFSGSGTQLVAAEQLRRRCCAIEIQPVFVDVAVRRWQALTGLAAVLDGDGRTYAELAGERLKAPAPPPATPETPVAKRARPRGRSR
jgi:DNA modification methylase